MTRPNEEYRYDHLEQTLCINEAYCILFSFYDHPMCGPAMRFIHLYNKNISIPLRIDNPGEDGQPCFFNDEILAIIDLTLKNPKNKLNIFQIICCLGLIHKFDQDLWNEINNKFEIEDEIINDIWDEKHTNANINPDSDNQDPFYDGNLDDLYPLPKIYVKNKLNDDGMEYMDGLKYYNHHKYGRIIIDEECIGIRSVRCLNDWWNEKQRLSFAKLSKLLIDHALCLYSKI